MLLELLSDNIYEQYGNKHHKMIYWRKSMGVEPMKDRLTAPYGFEGRIHHRMNSPSDFLMRLLIENCKLNYH